MKNTLYYLSACALVFGSISAVQPSVENMEWGKVIIEHENKTYIYRDCILWPTGHCNWDWNSTGTHHVPGIQVKDFWFLCDDEFDTMILSKGQCNRLHITFEAQECLKKIFTDVKVYICESNEAVRLYNKLVKEGKKVVLLLHSTC